MVRWIGLVLVLLASPARAEGVAVLQIAVGQDQVEVSADQIKLVRIEGPLLPAVHVTLDPALDEAVRALTAAHLDEVLTISVCGEVVMQPILRDTLTRAEFMLAVQDGAEARRVARLLSSRDCLR